MSLTAIRPKFRLRSSANYRKFLAGLGPAAYWKLDEAPGATTFADSGGSALTATGSGTYYAGDTAIFPGGGNDASVNWAGFGQAALASSASLDITAPAAYSFVTTYTQPRGNFTGFLYSKGPSAGTGHYIISFDNAPQCFEIGIVQDGSNFRKWHVNTPEAGVHHLVVSWNGNLATAPSVYFDGVAQTVTTSSAGTPTNLTNTSVFRLGGRSDGLPWPGFMQDTAWFNRAVSAAEVASLWALHQVANRSAAVPVIYDNDQGSTDKGDLSAFAQVIHAHRVGIINLLGVMVTCGDDFTAPASRAVLDYYGLTSIPVGAYKNSDIHVGGGTGTPARTIRDALRPTDTRANGIYADPASFYTTALTGQAAGSVVVLAAGFTNSISTFLNASAGNVTLWNAQVKHLALAVGEWPNSSTTATPAGVFTSTGPGEWNLGGSGSGTSEGPVEAQALVDIITKSTVPHYMHGVDICGDIGTLGNFISSDIPSAWSTSNPIRLGWATGARTSWDPMGIMLGLYVAKYGVSGNPYWTLTQLATPTISTALATAGQNTAVAGSSNNYYATPKLGALTLAQWRTLMGSLCDVKIPTFS